MNKRRTESFRSELNFIVLHLFQIFEQRKRMVVPSITKWYDPPPTHTVQGMKVNNRFQRSLF